MSTEQQTRIERMALRNLMVDAVSIPADRARVLLDEAIRRDWVRSDFAVDGQKAWSIKSDDALSLMRRPVWLIQSWNGKWFLHRGGV